VALGLERRQLERAVEPRVDVVAQRQRAVTVRELAHRHDDYVAQAVEKPGVFGVGEPTLRPPRRSACASQA